MAQTWHQLRPGEVRNDCGGCHAHSQKPTLFEKTAAAKPDYSVFDLTEKTPLLTSKAKDESGKQWDAEGKSGLAFAKGPRDVEYHRDVVPILNRSCVACHTKNSEKPAAGLVLDDAEKVDGLPGTYFRLAADDRARFSPRKLQGPGRNGELIVRDLQHNDNASHYVWQFQSRRSLLAWKVFGRRLDGWKNEDIPSEELKPDDPRRKSLHVPRGGEVKPEHRLYIGDIDYAGSVMPPPEAVASGKVKPLTDEDRLTLVRWIDLGCPIDLDPDGGGLGDDQRPTLTLAAPQTGVNPPLSRILVGMHDYNAGLDATSFKVTADFALDGVPAGQNLAAKFQPLSGNRWELKLATPITNLAKGTLTVSIKDRRGNVSRVERTFSVNSAR
jgi:hypothetical protein